MDLDGDGIETRGADGTVLFDHNGDGMRTGAGWVGTSTLQTTRDRATANGFTLIYMVPGQSIWDSLNDATTPLKPWPTSANCCATSVPPWRRAGWNGCNLLRTRVRAGRRQYAAWRREGGTLKQRACLSTKVLVLKY